MDNKRRLMWIDIAKALAIIAIVMGHSENKTIAKYLFWFHVPTFFIISGYFFKPITNKKEFYNFVKKKFCQLMIPYSTVLIIDTIYMYYTIINAGKFNITTFMKDLLKAFLGGNYHSSYYSAIWFLPCLFFTQILFMLIFMVFESSKYRIVIVLLSYCLAHIQSTYLLTHQMVKVPLNVDVTLIAIFYYAFGYYAKTLLTKIPKALGIILTFFSVGLIIMNYYGILNYELGLKRIAYYHFVLDAIIPISMSIALFYFSQQIGSVRWCADLLTALGTRSLVIMYLHKNINRIINGYVDYDFLLYTVIGVLVPYLLSWLIFERFNITRFLFLGSNVNRPSFH